MNRNFEIIGDIRDRQTFASGKQIRELDRLNKIYGKGRWRKCKGYAKVRRRDKVFEAEIHWYEAHGIGQFEFKIKQRL